MRVVDLVQRLVRNWIVNTCGIKSPALVEVLVERELGKRRSDPVQKFFVGFEAVNENGTKVHGYTFARKRSEAVKRAKGKAFQKELVEVWIAELQDPKSKLTQVLGPGRNSPGAIISTLLLQARATYVTAGSKKVKGPAGKPRIRVPNVPLLPAPKKESTTEIYSPYNRSSADTYQPPAQQEKVT